MMYATQKKKKKRRNEYLKHVLMPWGHTTTVHERNNATLFRATLRHHSVQLHSMAVFVQRDNAEELASFSI